MSEEEIDKTIKKVMKEIRESEDYYGNSCCAQSNSDSRQNNLNEGIDISHNLSDNEFCEVDAKD